jgi:ribosome biogenesis GTPase
MMHGVVIRDEGNLVHVDLPGEAEPLACIVRKSLRRSTGKQSKAVVVGDRVDVEMSGEGAAVVAVAPRTSTLSRPDPLHKHREHIIVANISTVLIVASARDPEFAPGLVDRFLVAVESRGLEAGIAINKIDLDPESAWRDHAALYRSLGYPVLAVSATRGEGLEEVRAFLRDKTTSLLGHSGVGKSSLANALDPSLALRVGDVRERSGKGQHTTTTVSLLPLPWGGYLVDTPGIREFGLWNMQEHDLAIWFRDLAPYVDRCRFNDCRHEHEPGCAVIEAVERGAIRRERYESYLRILASMGD